LVPLVALFVALGGTSYAAIHVPANSIGTKQLKRNAVTQPKIRANAVNGAKVVDDSIQGADVLESSLGKVPAAFHVDSAPTAVNMTLSCNEPFAPTTYLLIASAHPGTLSYFYSSTTTRYVGTDNLPGSDAGFDYGFDDNRIEGQFIWAGPGQKVATIKVDAV